MFTAGQLTPDAAAALSELWREYRAHGMRLSVTSWPLTVARPGRLQGQIIGIDPKALAGVTDDDMPRSYTMPGLCLVQGPDGWPVGIRSLVVEGDGSSVECRIDGLCTECDETSVPPPPPVPPPPVPPPPVSPPIPPPP